MFVWLALCSWRGSGERNGMQTYNRNVCEHGRNKIGIEGTRRSTKDYEGIRRNTKEYEGIGRNTPEYEETRRNTKEYDGLQRNTKEYKEIRRNTKEYVGKRGEYERKLT